MESIVDVIRVAIMNNMDSKDRSALFEANAILQALEHNGYNLTMSLRDKFAVMLMQSEIQSLNNMPEANITRYKKYLYKRWGEMSVSEALSKEVYNVSDDLIKTRNENLEIQTRNE